MTFSEFETTGGGTWRITAVVDYANGTQTPRDAPSVLEAAIAEAERLLGPPLAEDCLNEETSKLPIRSSSFPTDRSTYKLDRFALFSQPPRAPPRARSTARRSTNVVVETFFESVKYEYLRLSRDERSEEGTNAVQRPQRQLGAPVSFARPSRRDSDSLRSDRVKHRAGRPCEIACLE